MTNQKRYRRALRHRMLNSNNAISPLFGPWDRTVCHSDMVKWLLCPGSYLMWKEGDAVYRTGLSQEIGNMVHEETAKPAEQRMQDTAEIAARLKSVKPEERQAIAIEVGKLIAKAVRVSDKESLDAAITEHESLMVWYDSYTETFWYAKPDKMEVTRNERGPFLLLVDQKTGKRRKKTDIVGAFFFGYVAKMSKAFDFAGPIRSVVRYLRDWQGNILSRPEERDVWLGRQMGERQSETLWGIQETIRHMDENWQAGSFPLNKGDHCKGCQFRHTCPVYKEEFAEQERLRAEREQARNDGAAPIMLPVLNSGLPVMPEKPQVVATALPVVPTAANEPGSITPHQRVA